MSEKEKELVEELALKQATYSIDAIDCPNMIISRNELRTLIDIIYRLQQELTKYKERCEKAIKYIDNTFILTSRDYAKEISDFKINLKTILEDKENK